MNPMGTSVGGSGIGLAGLGTQSNDKKKACIDSMYFYGPLFKKLKMSVAGKVVDSSAGSLSLKNISDASIKFVVFWDSKVGSVSSSVSSFLNVKNMKNTVVEETSYAKSSKDNNMNEATPRKTHMQTYVLNNSPKKPLFEHISDNNTKLLLSAKSCVLKKWCFELVKSFSLDVKLSAVPKKTNSNKLISVKKIFYRIDNFGGASTFSKFSEIIKASFTLELNMNKAKKLAVCEKIIVNNNLKRVNSHSDWKIIVKKIPVNIPKLAVVTVFSKFGEIVLVKLQLVGLWQKALIEFRSAKVVIMGWSVLVGKNFVHVALAIGNRELWISKNIYHALLYTFLISTSAHDLSELVAFYGEKTCFIGHNPNSYVCNRCAIICFENKASKLVAIGLVLVFKSNSAGYKRWVVSTQNQVCLASIYKKKQASITCSISFGSITWVQVVGNSFSHMIPLVTSGFSVLYKENSSLTDPPPYVLAGLNNCLASLECSLKLLTDQVFGIIRKLSFVELVPLTILSHTSSVAASAAVKENLNSDMMLDGTLLLFAPLLPVVNDLVTGLGLSSLKILISKVSGLESKMVALEVLIRSVLDRLDGLCFSFSLPALLLSSS
ncbi:hypothetical protein G9A89_013046 [Geosiphon pyriformis]|nr:hypothetical protein G9A89_013046 [Geosiphon pyriformis]